MDEPTASLGEDESAALIRLIRQLTGTGIGIIYISHYLEEVFDIADTVTVLKNGEATGCYRIEECTHEMIIQKMVGREASLFYRRQRVEIDPNDVVLELKCVTREPLVKNVSFDVRRCEILGIGGLVGSGRTELARVIFGADRISSGSIVKNGGPINIKSPMHAIRMGICMLGEDRKQDGLFINRSILENIRIVDNEMKTFVSPLKDRASTKNMIDLLKIKATDSEQEVQYLSGGNQQKCIIARWILSKCDIVIFDEPTKGVDIGAREDIYELMVDLAKEGKAIIMISSDMPEILSMSDRICVMREGTVTHILENVQLSNEEELLKYYMGIA
jgi:ribose transport system ATP-binding protein